MNGRWMGAVVAAGLVTATTATADEASFPCTGCVVLGATEGPPRPLLVVLHGDEGGPSHLVATWRETARKNGMTLFAPQCPRDKGCVASYWQWDGDPSWLLGLIGKVAARYPVDPTRRYLAGWSGGSTYLAFHLSAWFPTFAAVSIAGGGAPGSDTGCFKGAGGACAPIQFVMGDRNPFFDLAVRVRDGARACGHDVTWNPLAGADHEAEWRFYASHTTDIATWLLAHADGCTPTAVPLPSASSIPSPPPSATEEPSSLAHRASPPSTTAAPVPVSRCACSFAGERCAPWTAGSIGLLAAAWSGRRKRRRLRASALLLRRNKIRLTRQT